jgi:hypothetical protein
MITVVVKENRALKAFKFNDVYEAEQAGYNITNEREYLCCGSNLDRYESWEAEKVLSK